jgi:hypothetical protein
MLVLGSNVAGKFVVYDRCSRPLVPFLCVAAEAAWHRGISEVRGARPIAFVVLVAHFIMNTAPLFTLSFPREVAQMAAEKYGIEHRGRLIRSTHGQQFLVLSTDQGTGSDGLKAIPAAQCKRHLVGEPAALGCSTAGRCGRLSNAKSQTTLSIPVSRLHGSGQRVSPWNRSLDSAR